MTALIAQNITVLRGTRRVLDDVSLTCEGGTLTGVIGPNGAGKTSLMRVLAGLDAPAHGSVTAKGEVLAALAPRVRGRLIAYLAQNETVAWPLDTQALVGLGRTPHRANLAPENAEDRAAVARALEKCAAQPFGTRAVTTLSAGERARVLLARALAVEAPILIADEPVAALDPFHQLGVMAALKDEAARGAAVIVVLHDLTLAARFCDALAVLHEGRLVAQGTPPEILQGDVLARAFNTRFHRGTHEGAPFVLPWSPL